jgi:hypothetical protein
MKRLTSAFILLIISIFLATCSVKQAGTVPAVPVDQENTPIYYHAPTQTSTITVTTEPSKAPTGTKKVVEPLRTCRENEQSGSSDAQIGMNGSILFADPVNQKYSVWIGSSRTIRYLPIPWMSDIVGFSPNGEWISWLEKDKLKVISRTGVVKEVKVDIDSLMTGLPPNYTIGGWFNIFWQKDDQIFLQLGYYDYPDAMTTTEIDGYINPFTGEWQDLWIKNLPDIITEGPTFRSPNGNLFFYASKDLSGKVFILYDSSKNNELWSKASNEKYSSRFLDSLTGFIEGKWSPDSSKFAFVDPNEDGNGIRILSSSGKEFAYIPTMNRDFEPYDLKWSSDSRDLAYIDFDPQVTNIAQSNILWIYDTKQKKSTFRCPMYSSGKDDTYYNENFEWSPNNNFIAYTYKPNSPLRFISLITGNVTLMDDNVSLLGWSEEVWNLQ